MLHATPLTIDRRSGKSDQTCIYALAGPLILRNMFELQSELRRTPPQPLTVLDLSGVPYMDSAGMGLVVNHYVHCQNKGARLVVAGANNRVLDLFKITRVDTILPLAPSVEDAETDA